eukprot:scaffold718_cov342-Pavlova_lutheri.AAC.9
MEGSNPDMWLAGFVPIRPRIFGARFPTDPVRCGVGLSIQSSLFRIPRNSTVEIGQPGWGGARACHAPATHPRSWGPWIRIGTGGGIVAVPVSIERENTSTDALVEPIPSEESR